MFNGRTKGILGNGYLPGIIPKFTPIEVIKIKNLGTQHLYVFWNILQLDFLFEEKIMFRSRDIEVFVFL